MFLLNNFLCYRKEKILWQNDKMYFLSQWIFRFHSNFLFLEIPSRYKKMPSPRSIAFVKALVIRDLWGFFLTD